MRGIITYHQSKKSINAPVCDKIYLYLITHIRRVMKALFFRIGAIGDALLTTPAVRVFKETFPDCEVHYMAGRGAAKILENNPYIDKVIVFNERFFKVPRFLRVLLMAPGIKKSIDPYYDYFIDFESSHYSAMISRSVNSGSKFGFLIKGKKRGYNKYYKNRFDYKQQETYIAYRHMALAVSAGAKAEEDITPVFKLTDAETEEGRGFYSANKIEGPVVHVCLSGTWTAKKWPLNHWKELIKLLSEKINVVVIWGPGDEGDIEQIKQMNLARVFITPDLGLRQMASVLSFGKVLITNDNGVRHIAGALGLNTVGLFGPTNEKSWADINKKSIVLVSNEPCRPCDKTSCPDLKCMEGISVKSVLEAADKFI